MGKLTSPNFFSEKEWFFIKKKLLKFNYSVSSIDLAYDHFVLRKSVSSISKERNLSRQRISALIASLREALLLSVPNNKDWVLVDGLVPKEVADQLQEEINAYILNKESS